jgi:acyl carrier protein
MNTRDERIAAMREIVSEILELEDDELTETSSFVDDHGADSLRAIEIMTRVEKKFKVRIPQNDLPKMTNVANLYKVVAEHAGWKE